MIKLTPIEAQAIQGILDSDYMDGDTGDAAIDRPVWTWSANPFPNKRTFSGAVSSLTKKGFVSISEYDTNEWIISITAAGMAAFLAGKECTS